jgi:hypothetical protein
MIPARAPRLLHRPGRVYEEKIDGYRMVAVKDGSRVRLHSRLRDGRALPRHRGDARGTPGTVTGEARRPLLYLTKSGSGDKQNGADDERNASVSNELPCGHSRGLLRVVQYRQWVSAFQQQDYRDNEGHCREDARPGDQEEVRPCLGWPWRLDRDHRPAAFWTGMVREPQAGQTTA